MSEEKIDLDRITRVLLKMRDAREELTRNYEAEKKKIDEQMKTLENVLLNELNTKGLQSFRTSACTVYKEEVLTPTGSDWDAFYRWVAENDGFDFLERRIKRTSIKEYMEANGGAVPPGVSVYREYVARVRRK